MTMVVVRAGSKPASWVLGLLLAGSGCGFESDLPTTTKPPSPPVPPTQAAIALSLSSSPIDAVVAVDGSAPWSAEWTLNVKETAGIGGNIDSVRATLADSAGASIAETELGADQVSEQLGGSNHIRGGSTQGILLNLNFDFPAETPSGDLHVTLQLSDDRGNTVSAAVDDVIQVCVPSQVTPDEGAKMDNGCTNRENGILWEFDWSDCAGVEAYEFYLRQRNAQEPSVNQSTLTTSSYTVLEERVVPEESRNAWFWKVRAQVNGVWGNWSPERNFEVEPVNTDCVTP
jgi:hypothetical protein